MSLDGLIQLPGVGDFPQHRMIFIGDDALSNFAQIGYEI
jgi:hypothetical protein